MTTINKILENPNLTPKERVQLLLEHKVQFIMNDKTVLSETQINSLTTSWKAKSNSEIWEYNRQLKIIDIVQDIIFKVKFIEQALNNNLLGAYMITDFNWSDKIPEIFTEEEKRKGLNIISESIKTKYEYNLNDFVNLGCLLYKINNSDFITEAYTSIITYRLILKKIEDIYNVKLTFIAENSLSRPKEIFLLLKVKIEDLVYKFLEDNFYLKGKYDIDIETEKLFIDLGQIKPKITDLELGVIKSLNTNFKNVDWEDL